MAKTYFSPTMGKPAWRNLAAEAARPGAEVAAKTVKSRDGSKQLMLYVRSKDTGLKRVWRDLTGVAQKRRDDAKHCLFAGLVWAYWADPDTGANPADALKNVRDRTQRANVATLINSQKRVDGAALEKILHAAFPNDYVNDGYLGPALTRRLEEACVKTAATESFNFLKAARALRDRADFGWAEAEALIAEYLLPTSAQLVNLKAECSGPFKKLILDCSSEEFLGKLATPPEADDFAISLPKKFQEELDGAIAARRVPGQAPAQFDKVAFLKALDAAEMAIRKLLLDNVGHVFTG